ncbi:Lateral flagellin [Duganella sp. BJB488]|uniref:Flagellin n=1 Tax=Duganella vulcania TaxID=2692166 RepID=A0A845HJR6_9BURK|nr:MULTISPECIES: flagellin [Duganella]MYN19011.1 Lateral flagellin [Duganella vulcania]NVD69736.1 Lateral flagellin [Duganella sp. BJB1802]RFP10250.1 Lateral flagellin [Duganella sp. BJB489]RFP18151.1 Lateral flagellin [Duganella sp. BJB488]RFP37912.1 Lateral flagellin [Duganella sp. BJB480]
MLSLHTNAAALSAQNSISRTQMSLSTSQTRLSTGFRVNSAMDDAAGLQIATRLKAQSSGMAMAMRNTQNSISMLQTAEGAFDEVTTMLTRMKDLATQAADASSTAKDQAALQSEFDALGSELNNVMKNTTFGGAKLMDGGTLSASMTFQIGATKAETMSIDLSAAMTTLTGAGGLGGVSARYAAGGAAVGSEISDGTDGTASASNAAGQTAANATIDTISTAIDLVGGVRSSLGAAANRLDHVYNNLSNISTNTKAATGRIMDTDFASESSNMTSSQMLLQAGTAMLKQSNSTSSLVMSLLQ